MALGLSFIFLRSYCWGIDNLRRHIHQGEIFFFPLFPQGGP